MLTIKLGGVPNPTGGVVAVLDGGPGGRTAVRLGAQLALARRVELGLCTGVGRRAAKQCAVALESLARRGIPARAVDQGATVTGLVQRQL